MESIIAEAERADLISILNSYQKNAPTFATSSTDKDESNNHHKRLKQKLDPLRKALIEFDAEKYMNLKRCTEKEIRRAKDVGDFAPLNER